MKNNYHITPLELGNLELDQSEVTVRSGMGKVVPLKFTSWFIGGGDLNILVDSGPPIQDVCDMYHNYCKPEVLEIEKVLKIVTGLEPDQIDLVILTHLHWDHCANLNLFPRAKIVVSEKEMLYNFNLIPLHYTAYHALQIGLKPLIIDVMKQIHTVPMEKQEIVAGISMVPTPGHSPGQMSVVVQTSNGQYIIAGDAILNYDNFNADPLKGTKFKPAGIYVDMQSTWKSMEYLLELSGNDINKILPTHDPRIFYKKRYP